MIGLAPTALNAVVFWTGNITADALASVDPQIAITGDVLLGDAANDNVEIFADTGNMTVSVVGADRVITANDSGGGGGEKGLNLRANAGFTINLNLDHSLAFASDNENFVVSFSGAGNLRVRIADGETFELRGSGANSTGTYFLVNTDAVANTPNVEDVCFFRQSTASNANVEVLVGDNCVLGFMGDTANDTGIIAFDPSNNVANTGRMILRVADDGAVAVQVYTTANDTTPLASNITFTTLVAGSTTRGIMQVKTQGGGAWAGLLVVNENTVLPEFRSNPWCDDAPLDANNELVVGIQPGFVIGKNGRLDVLAGAYFDYIATQVNVSPTPTIPAAVLNKFEVNGITPQVNTLVKDRNASALMTDGPVSVCANLPHPQIYMHQPAKIYFRSSADDDGPTGNVNYLVAEASQFTEAQGYGSIVFDVEGICDVQGDPDDADVNNTAINILSLRESDVGGSVLIEGSETIFKLRPNPHTTSGASGASPIKDQYGKACFMINGRLNLYETALQHTDETHRVFEKNIPQESEATYIGGESFRLCEDRSRPRIAYYDSDLLLHSSAAFTGVDQSVANINLAEGTPPNNSDIVFYHNGYCIDQGTGRSLILGTNIGALASDIGTIINRDAHFDVYEEFNGSAENLVAQILTRPNNTKVTENLTGTITNEYSVHSFFLGHGTNVSIGTNGTNGNDPCTGTFTPSMSPTLFVNGDFIAFESQGGILNKPETSIISGQGGIFIDTNGLFELANNRRMSLATMVGLGFNGAIDLKSRNTYIDSRVGIARSNLDLSVVAQQDIVPAGTNIPDFTLDWKYVTKDTCSGTGFIPYVQPDTPAACACPAPVARNVAGIPTINGEVYQFQVANSRLGDPAHIKVDAATGAGKIRELVFLSGDGSGVAPVGVVVLDNDAEVGLGSTQRHPDDQSGIVLGINGVTLMPDGSAQVFLNEDVIINNVCHILAGPNFGGAGVDKLTITSEVPREIRVAQGGVFDLSLFNTANKQLEIGGKVTLVFEPNTRFIMGGGELIVTDDASIQFERFVDAAFPTGAALIATNEYRVRHSGSGTVRVKENGFIDIPRGSLVGVESGGVETVTDSVGQDQTTTNIVNCTYVTNLNWVFEDAAQLYIGGRSDYGGGLQVGNTTDLSGNGGAVSFSLTLNGIGAAANIDSQGFLGLGVGIVDKKDVAPNSWIVAPTFNVVSTSITVTEGIFRHDQAYTGTDENASLLAYAAASTGHTFSLNTVTPTNAILRGGGNMVLTSAQGAPTVLTTDSAAAGILSSRPTLDDPTNTVPTFPTSVASIFAYLKALPFASQIVKYAQAFNSSLGVVTISYVNGTTIVRDDIVGVRGNSGAFVDPARSLELGAVVIALSTNNDATVYAVRN